MTAIGVTMLLISGIGFFLLSPSTIKGMEETTETSTETSTEIVLEENVPEETEAEETEEIEADEEFISEGSEESEQLDSSEGFMGIAPMYAVTGSYSLQNGGFEERQYILNSPNLVSQTTVPGWMTTASDGILEIPNGTGGGHNFRPQEGKQWMEINANVVGELYQVVKTVPGSTLRWSLWHSGRLGNDTMSINIGTQANHPSVRQVTSAKQTWTNYTGTYVVPAGQTDTYFGFQAISSSSGNNSVGNYIDNIVFKMNGILSSTKSVDKTSVKTNDIVTYKVRVTNTLANSESDNVVVEDTLPAGTELVAGSLKLNGASVSNETATANTIKKTIPTITGNQTMEVSFQAKVTKATNGTIKNIAKVTDPNQPSNTSNPEVSLNVTAPGNLSATKLVDKSIAKTNDEVVYTIQMSNTLSNTNLTNVKVVDQLPAGVTLVPNSLKLNGVTTANARLDSSNTIEKTIPLISGNQTVSVSFRAKVTQDTEGIIKNVATVTDPAKPTDIKNPEVKSLVFNGDAPATGLLIGGNDFEIYKSDLVGLSNSELNQLIIEQGHSYVWDIETATEVGINLSVKNTTLTNNPIEGRMYKAVLEAEKGTLTTSQEISIFVHYPAETLIIDSAPSILDFGTKKISYSDIKVDNPEYDNPLVVHDNRSTPTEWVLTATLETPLMNQADANKIIPDAIRYQVDSENTVILSTGDAQTIVAHTHSSTGHYNVSDNWASENTGFQLEIPAGTVRKLGNYQATILWQLGQTP